LALSFSFKISRTLKNRCNYVLNISTGSVYCNASELDGKGANTFMFGNYVNSTTGFTVASAFMINPYSLPEYKVGFLTSNYNIQPHLL